MDHGLFGTSKLGKCLRFRCSTSRQRFLNAVPPTNVLLWGDEAAATLAQYQFRRWAYLTISALMVATVGSTVGTIGFSWSNHSAYCSPACWVRSPKTGANRAGNWELFYSGDARARTILGNAEVPIGILTAVVMRRSCLHLTVARNYSFRDGE